MIEVAKKIKWMPEFGLGRELDWLKNMHDWLISKKNRYWGLALPIYECKECGHFEVIDSKKELEKKAVSGWEEFKGHTPHKPFIDQVKIKCPKCGKPVSRIDDVGNPWLDAGIVAYSTIAQNNQGMPLYLKDRESWRHWFPANFITESFPGQFKNWFYALIAMSTVLENERPFERVLGFGTLLGEDGRPMHKSWGNAIEFREAADKIGVDVARWMFSRQNPADNMLFGYKKADEVRRQFYLMYWNIYKYFVEYANLDKFKVQNSKFKVTVKKNVLDRWILARFMVLIEEVEKNMKNYNAKDSAMMCEEFVSDLSTWYLRRSRDRVWVTSDDEKDKRDFYETLYYILVNITIMLSPFMPFVTEEIYTNLVREESVHLAFWPDVDVKLKDEKLVSEMAKARKLAEAGHAIRKTLGKKVRIPLANVDIKIDLSGYKNISHAIYEVLLKELNVKNISVNGDFHYPKKRVEVSEDDLAKEGALREFVRQIQSKRKELGLKPKESIDLTIPEIFLENSDYIKKRVIARGVKIGKELIVSI